MVSTRTDVLAARNGDATAFARLVHDNAGAVCAITTAILGSTTAGEEVGQEVFVSAWQGLNQLHDPDRFGLWLRSIARNRAHEALRSRIHRREVTGDALLLVADPAPDAGERLDGERLESTLWDALGGLDDDHREVLVLYYREGRSVDEVARQLGLTEPTARKRLSRARERLRDDVEDRLARRLVQTAPKVSAFVAAVCLLIAALPAKAATLPLWLSRAASVAIVGAAGVALLTVGTYTHLQHQLPEIVAPPEARVFGSIVDPDTAAEPARVVPEHVIHAFLAAEDARFFEHGPVDVRAIGRATLHNWTEGGETQGASTLTQQLAKRLLIDQMPRPSLRRKITEVVMAIELERQLTKDQILASYLDGVYLGAGAFGLTEAARVYFGKSPSDLTLGEAALLAGIPSHPQRYEDPEAAEQRQAEVLDQMEANGWASPSEVAAAKAVPVLRATR